MNHILVASVLATCGHAVGGSQLYVMKDFGVGAIADDNPYEIGTLDLKQGPKNMKPIKKFVEPQWKVGFCSPEAVVGGDDNSIFLFASPGCYERGGTTEDKQFADPKVMRYNPRTNVTWVGGNFQDFRREGYQMGAMFHSTKWSPVSQAFLVLTEYVWQQHEPTIWYVDVWDPSVAAGQTVHKFPTGLDDGPTPGVYPYEGPHKSVIHEDSNKLYVLITSSNFTDLTLHAKQGSQSAVPGQLQMKIFDLPSMSFTYADATGLSEDFTLIYDNLNKEIIGISAWQFGTVSCPKAQCSFTVAGTLSRLAATWGQPGNITGPDVLNHNGATFDPVTRQLSVSTTGCYKLGDPTWGCEGNTDTQKFAQFTLPKKLEAGEVVLAPTYYYEQFTNLNDGNSQDWYGMVLAPEQKIAEQLIV